jgi:hypothetical protein
MDFSPLARCEFLRTFRGFAAHRLNILALLEKLRKRAAAQVRPAMSSQMTSDDPSFNAPIFASLIEGEEDAYNLIWRSRRRNSV